MGGFDPVDFLEGAVPLASNEDVGEMRAFLVETLESNGVEATVDDAGNTLASKGAADPETHLVFNTHIDTVSPHVPFRRDGDVIRGRGSCDAKGPLSALLAAFVAVVAAAKRLGLAEGADPVTVSPPGGDLEITVPDVGPATLTGPAAYEFETELDVAVRSR